MYRVTIQNGNISTVIHDYRAAANAQKLSSGSIVDAVNSISSFSFKINPANTGYDSINEYTTLISVYNVQRARYDFIGRVLQCSPAMDNAGKVVKSVVCEDRLGYLQDSIQPYTDTRHYEGDETRSGLEEFIDVLLDNHNAQVEEYKRIYRGTVTVDPFETSSDVTKGLNWETTFNCISEKLIKSFGGYIRLREVGGVLYLDYLKEIGETRATVIEVGRNMSAATKEVDASGIITRLIPLGAKLSEISGAEGETGNDERLTVASVNDGLIYIESAEYIEKYGIRYSVVQFDDVTDATNLKRKGEEYMMENNGLTAKHDVDALELSLVGLDIDDFVLYDRYPVKNALIGVNEILQIVKKTTNVPEPHKSSFEMGATKVNLSESIIDKITQSSDRVTSEFNSVADEIRHTINTQGTAVISSCEAIILAALEQYVTTSNLEEYRETVSAQLQIMADEIAMSFSTVTEQIMNVDGDLQSKYAEILKYISFGDDGITIGSSDNSITLRLDNTDGIIFSKNGIPFGRWDGNDFFTGNIVIDVDERAQFGNFAYIPRSDGSLMFLKVADYTEKFATLIDDVLTIYGTVPTLADNTITFDADVCELSGTTLILGG